MILRFHDATDPVVVEVRVPGLVEPATALFRPHLVDPGKRPGAAGDQPSASPAPAPDVVVAGEEGRYLLEEKQGDAGPADERIFESESRLLSALELAILRRLLARRPEVTHLHAAGAVVAERAVVALGGSGAGKSSLGLAWSLTGLPLLGDDLLLVEPDGRLRAFPRLIKAEAARLSDHGLRLDETVAPEPGHPEIWFDPEEAGGWARGAFRAAVIARVRYDGGPETRLEPADRSTALAALLGSVVEGGRSPEESMDGFIETLDTATVVEVRFGSAPDAAERLAALAEEIVDGR